MAYKIAVGSSDGKRIDLKFGEVEKFIIYEVEGTQYKVQEIRLAVNEENNGQKIPKTENCTTEGCSTSGCSGNGHGCQGGEEITQKVSIIEDCRCVVCKKIGFQAQKQFEKKAISVFDVECEVSEALEKISNYYEQLEKRKRK